jgi:hypothetical protein
VIYRSSLPCFAAHDLQAWASQDEQDAFVSKERKEAEEKDDSGGADSSNTHAPITRVLKLKHSDSDDVSQTIQASLETSSCMQVFPCFTFVRVYVWITRDVERLPCGFLKSDVWLGLFMLASRPGSKLGGRSGVASRRR